MYKKNYFLRSKLALSLIILLCAVALTVLAVMAAGAVVPVIDYDPPYLPEGIAVDKSGNIYVGMNEQAEIRKITPDGSESVLATLPTGGVGLLGLAVDAPGNVYAGLATLDGVTSGVYRVDRAGSISQIPGSEAILMPNAMVFDNVGNLYVTDSVQGIVWRVAHDGAVEPWLADDLLFGTGDFNFGIPIGANGIVYRDRMIYVANSEKGHIVAIAVNKDGTPGTPQILIDGSELVGVDGLALDVHGDLYAAIVTNNQLLRINMDDLNLSVIADEGFDAPASLAFGTGKGDRQNILITNFALLTEVNPGVVKVDVGVPGLPLP